MSSSIEAQAFDYFLVLDFEATCEENKKLVPQVAWRRTFFENEK